MVGLLARSAEEDAKAIILTDLGQARSKRFFFDNDRLHKRIKKEYCLAE